MPVPTLLVLVWVQWRRCRFTILSMSAVTKLLSSIEAGDDPNAAAELLPLVYQELRKLAASKLARENAGQTIQATELVHEAWLRLVGKDANIHWQGRGPTPKLPL